MSIQTTSGRALTREDLDKQSCQMPNCDHTSHDGLYLHGACHLHAAVVCQYLDGVLLFYCAKCGGSVARIAVASGSLH
jgi:hypothetical protein